MKVITSTIPALNFAAYQKAVHKWVAPAHQQPWVESLQALADGRLVNDAGKPVNRLMILAFPGSGKTDTSIQFNAWLIGRETMFNRIPQCGYIAYADSVAWIRSQAIRDTITLPAYQEVFPLAEPSKAKGWGKEEWYLQRDDPSKKDPTLRAAGFGGSVLSHRFPTIMTIDDPLSEDQAQSPTERTRIWRSWNDAVQTRSSEITPIILICTRFASDDLAGRILDTQAESWKVITTEAVDEEGRTVWPLSLHDGNPVGISTERLEEIKRQSPTTYLTQYLVRSPTEEGGVFTTFREGDSPDPSDIKKIYQFWDTATYAKKTSDHQAMVEYALLSNGNLHQTYAIDEKISAYDVMKRAADEHHRAKDVFDRPVATFVENKSSGGTIVMSMRKLSGIAIDTLNIPNDKLESRAAAVTPYFETGRVTLPRDEWLLRWDGWQPWKDNYLAKMRGFPHERYDDLVAATTLGITYLFITRKGRPAPLFAHWKRHL